MHVVREKPHRGTKVTWTDIEGMTEEEYSIFCLEEAGQQVKLMTTIEYLSSYIQTLYWLSPLGFLFSTDMSIKCFKLLVHKLHHDNRSGLNSN